VNFWKRIPLRVYWLVFLPATVLFLILPIYMSGSRHWYDGVLGVITMWMPFLLIVSVIFSAVVTGIAKLPFFSKKQKSSVIYQSAFTFFWAVLFAISLFDFIPAVFTYFWG
jgi:hypothetical protein